MQNVTSGKLSKIEASSRTEFDLGYGHFKTTSEAEKQQILEERNSSSTNKATKGILKILTDYIFEKKNMPDVEQTTDTQLPQLLETFYAEVCQQNGEMYKLASLKCICAGLNRHFKETRSLDIISDPKFTKANEIFKGSETNQKKWPWINKELSYDSR